MAHHRTSTLLAVAALLALPLLSACGSDDPAAAAGTTVQVSASDHACELDRTELAAGTTSFDITNEGSKTTEVYVYAPDGEEYTKVISEVENIGPGLSRSMEVELDGGTYEVACKPGQTGDGIRTKITANGDDGGGSE